MILECKCVKRCRSKKREKIDEKISSICSCFFGRADVYQLWFAFVCQGGDTGLNVSLKEKVDRFLDSLPVPFNGTILIGVGEKILVHKGYGLANRSFDIPNKPDTKYLSGP